MDVVDGGSVTAKAIETRGSFGGNIFSTAPGIRVSGPGSSVAVVEELAVVATGGGTFGNRVSVSDGASLSAGSARVTGTAGFGRDSQAFVSSGGVLDIDDRLDVGGDGVILTGGGGVTTFFDDLHHSGGEIRTAAGATTVVFCDDSGDGPLTGGGDVRLEGGVALGNSPAVVSFGGDLLLGVESFTAIELAGTGIGDFDRFEVAGDFTIGGRLTTALIDGFKLSAGQSFEIAEAGGTLFGRFDGLADGDRVATFGGHSLLIDYGTSHVRLFAVAIPEPGGAALMIVAGFAAMWRRRSR